MELGPLFVRYLHHFDLYVLTPVISLFTAGTMIGFDASGHIAEETKNAR